jgi:hypothetical protein
MISNVVVTYTVKPECVEEHIRLIRGIFAQLDEDAPTELEYKVLTLDDGVSFVHVSTADTVDGSNPLPQLAAFQAFAKDLPDRVATAPAPTGATIIGSYHPAVAS